MPAGNKPYAGAIMADVGSLVSLSGRKLQLVGGGAGVAATVAVTPLLKNTVATSPTRS